MKHYVTVIRTSSYPHAINHPLHFSAPNLSTIFSAARETLFMKRPKAAFFLSSGLYLADTMAVEGT